MPLSLESVLTQHKKAGLYRVRSVLQGVSGVQRIYKGKTLVSFCSNDYLGLAQHPDAINSFKQTVEEFGLGSSSSHFLGAYSRIHCELEEALAEFTGYPRALVFSTGYMANLSILTALLTRHNNVFGDKLNHASLVDAAKLSGASFKRYPHKKILSLEKLVTSSPARSFIVTDGVFSMDGDLAELPDLIAIAKNYSATLLVDDAHGLGVLGKKGGGISEHFGLKPDILSGGFGKALGSFGGFATGSEALIENLIQFSRPYMYTTALPPAVAKATHTNLRLLQKENWRREKLISLIEHFKCVAKQLELPFLESLTPIQPLLIGDPEQTMKLATYLLKKGFLVNAIRPPTVPKKTSRLRISLNALHSEKNIDSLLEQIARGLKSVEYSALCCAN
ncbi:MAG: 8-amino-7-oxononanoate synthase [Rickettsiella sp.]|nr:8-amino-7-oxononanoate synthase [Rickettsiella sp.]